MLTFRQGNIELRLTHTYGKESKIYYEIIKWYPNEYFGHEDDYIWDDSVQMYKRANIDYPYYIHPNCFKKPETCYSIATLVPHHKFEDEHDIKSVGSRVVNLNEQDLKDYLDVVRYSFEHYNELYDSEDKSIYLVK